MVSVVIHSNPRLENQIESAGWLKTGFEQHGFKAEVTADINQAGDIHVVQGPWYAFNAWLGKPNVLFLNRCFYGHARWDVSIGWLNPDGTRDFRNQEKTEAKGTTPDLKPRKDYRGTCVVFGDFGRDMKAETDLARSKHQRVYFRQHPADHKNRTPIMTIGGELSHIWGLCDCAVGHSSTVLVEAEIEGLQVTSTDPDHVVHHDGDRQQWINKLSWCQWNHEEIKRGEFWEHLNESRAA